MTWNSQAAGGAGPPLPSLNALWTFDAVARHGSMTRAAAELGVTQTAVSHQVRRLEDELGYALFRRVGNRMEVSAEGAAWAEQLGPVFSRLRGINQQLRGKKPHAHRSLSLSVIPSFGARFLTPRLGEFLRSHADVQLRVAATERMVDLDLERVDIAVRYGKGRHPGFHVTRLAGDEFVPVASVSYLDGKRLRKISNLAHVDLLHDDYPDVWSRWFEHAHSPETHPKRMVQYTESSMLVQATLLGQGVALCRRSLVQDEFASGRLVRLFPTTPPMPCELAYYVLVSEHAASDPLVGSFVSWMKRQVTDAGLPP